MNAVLRIAGEEWRLWRRSRLATLALGLLALVLIAACLLTAARMLGEYHARTHQQTVAEETFLAQPARHPHRMVHYGHYAFRAPPPLAIIDPGVDAVTGQSIFLEGHRQNTAMFADARAGANLGGLGEMTPALVYQLLVPLLLIALGHGVLVRERETGTLAPMLAQGLSPRTLFLGKAVSLVGLSGVFLVPLVLLCVVGVMRGESVAAALALLVGYALYLLAWCLLIVLASCAFRQRGVVLAVLVLVWLVWSLAMPRLAVASANIAHPARGKIETDFVMSSDMRAVGDSHNAADAAFAELRANLLAQYDVDRVEDLPVNLRGIVAEYAEAKYTQVLNQYAEERMALESRQAAHASLFGWLSPQIAVGTLSRALSGTDLSTHHRFLRETEALRFRFVQGLNKVHAEQLRYIDDINRSSDPEAERRTRISAENWKVLESFRFEPAAANERIHAAALPLWMLTLWGGALFAGGFVAMTRVKP